MYSTRTRTVEWDETSGAQFVHSRYLQINGTSKLNFPASGAERRPRRGKYTQRGTSFRFVCGAPSGPPRRAPLTRRKFAHLISDSAQTESLSYACLLTRVLPLVSASAICSFVSPPVQTLCLYFLFLSYSSSFSLLPYCTLYSWTRVLLILETRLQSILFHNILFHFAPSARIPFTKHSSHSLVLGLLLFFRLSSFLSQLIEHESLGVIR